MRCLVSFGDEEARPSRLHDIIAFYRDSNQLQNQIDESHRHESGGYDYSTYDDVKPESMDNPPVQHIDIMAANKHSKEPKVHFGGSSSEESINASESLESAVTAVSDSSSESSS